MSLVFCDSHTDQGNKWDKFAAAILATGGPNDAPAIDLGAGDVRMKFPSFTGGFVLGIWFYPENDDTWSGESAFLVLADDTHTTLAMPSDGIYWENGHSSSQIQEIFIRSGGATVGSFTWSPGAFKKWFYLECLFDVAAGEFKFYVDGVLHETIAGTLPGTVSWTHLMAESPSSLSHIHISQPYLVSLDATAPNGLLGEVTVESYDLTTQGTHDDFTGSDGTMTKPEILSTTYTMDKFVSASTDGAKDTYNTEAIDTPYAILGVQVSALARRGDTDPWQIAPVIRRGGVDQVLAPESLPDAAGGLFWPVSADPHTGSAWKIGDFNGTEFGIEASLEAP